MPHNKPENSSQERVVKNRNTTSFFPGTFRLSEVEWSDDVRCIDRKSEGGRFGTPAGLQLDLLDLAVCGVKAERFTEYGGMTQKLYKEQMGT